MTTAIAILVLVAGVMLTRRHAQRAFFYPAPSALSNVVDENIESTLQCFEAVQLHRSPEVLKALHRGLSNERIREIEARHRLRRWLFLRFGPPTLQGELLLLLRRRRPLLVLRVADRLPDRSS